MQGTSFCVAYCSLRNETKRNDPENSSLITLINLNVSWSRNVHRQQQPESEIFSSLLAAGFSLRVT